MGYMSFVTWMPDNNRMCSQKFSPLNIFLVHLVTLGLIRFKPSIILVRHVGTGWDTPFFLTNGYTNKNKYNLFYR